MSKRQSSGEDMAFDAKSMFNGHKPEEKQAVEENPSATTTKLKNGQIEPRREEERRRNNQLPNGSRRQVFISPPTQGIINLRRSPPELVRQVDGGGQQRRGPKVNAIQIDHTHETKNSSWLPPMDSWSTVEHSLPFGWEAAADKEGNSYFINHLNKTTTYEDPRKEDEEPPPEPRDFVLHRDSELGFGFVAGSERPVLVRFVKEGGPSEGRLQAGDHIIKINGEDVSRAPREHVIELVKSCKHTVTLTVCQPHTNNSARKSAILTAAKKAKLKSNPSRVRFAEGVVINGSPLCPSSPFDTCVPYIPNVLKVFLENGQTKTFKYDSTTCVQDVLNSLIEKLSIKCGQHFSLCVEHIKAIRRNKLTLLDPKDSLAKIASRPGAHNLRCLFRVAFVPKDAAALLQRDPISFEYLYVQCCNDVTGERFSLELKYEIALRLAALQLHQHAISNGMLSSSGKVNLKAIEKECGLHAFVPLTLLESMKRKELHKLLNHFLKQNQQLCPSGQKTLTALQAKVHYLRIIGELPSFGAKLFASQIRDSQVESAVLVSPRYGLSHVSGVRNCTPLTLARIEDITCLKITKDSEDLCYSVEVQLRPNCNNGPDPPPLRFALDDKDSEEFCLALQGYHRLFTGSGWCNGSSDSPRKELPIYRDIGEAWWSDSGEYTLNSVVSSSHTCPCRIAVVHV